MDPRLDKRIQLAILESRGLSPTRGNLQRLCITYHEVNRDPERIFYEGNVMSFASFKNIGDVEFEVNLKTGKVKVQK
jgi:hypothetical protein